MIGPPPLRHRLTDAAVILRSESARPECAGPCSTLPVRRVSSGSAPGSRLRGACIRAGESGHEYLRNGNRTEKLNAFPADPGPQLSLVGTEVGATRLPIFRAAPGSLEG